MTPGPNSEPLSESEMAGDPLEQFGAWFEDAVPLVRLPEAVALATADAGGRPSLRMVLMKGFDERGFVFHTHYDSRKARELAANPVAALLFHWAPLGRQVRIEGTIEKVSAEESDRYFETRPRGGQIGAHASQQSQPIARRDLLDQRVAELSETYEGRPVPRPESWGGFRLRPESFEFWQNRDDRLHDRIRYTRAGNSWSMVRLQP
ncbi:MAG TPA: pyridoxamine 5'-phosphate oxidase [Acidimicrobiales bacterium]|nr:pyridoxamine 5'-phosphate oxidase [Acidimicrobiales bacterium]